LFIFRISSFFSSLYEFTDEAFTAETAQKAISGAPAADLFDSPESRKAADNLPQQS
jgi:hypothetical protein